jgi:hypothetical protein
LERNDFNPKTVVEISYKFYYNILDNYEKGNVIKHTLFQLVKWRYEMSDFILCIVQYLLIAIAIAAIGAVGAIIGIAIRKKMDAKKAQGVAQNTEE